MEELIIFQTLSAQLDQSEFNTFLAKINEQQGRDRDIVTKALFRTFLDEPAGIIPYSDIVSSIIESRENPHAEPALLRLDSLPSALIGECASFLKQPEYFRFGKSNRRIYLGCYSPRTTFWTPAKICITGYDTATTAKFKEYAEALGIELSSKWAVGSTDILISKSNIQNGKPHITFKVLASILRNIPVVKESFLEDSYESGRILDHQKYICNYRRVENEQLFGGLSILFAV